MISDVDGETGVLGITPDILILKDGASSWAAAAGAVTEIGSGWYRWEGAAADRDTKGYTLVQCSGTGAEPYYFGFNVKADDLHAFGLETNREVVDVVDVDTWPEPAALPGYTLSFTDMLRFLYQLARAKWIDNNNTDQQFIYKEDETVLGTASRALASNVYTRTEWS